MKKHLCRKDAHLLGEVVFTAGEYYEEATGEDSEDYEYWHIILIGDDGRPHGMMPLFFQAHFVVEKPAPRKWIRYAVAAILTLAFIAYKIITWRS